MLDLPRMRQLVVLVAVCLLACTSVFAQEPATRADLDRQRREEKARALRPHQPNRVERAIRFAENNALFLLDREGVYPKLGSLTTGSGFAYGAGYRDRDLFNYTGAVDVWAASSIRGYWVTEARLTFPELARKRLHLEGWASHREYPQEDFFGLGPTSRRNDQSDYALRTNLVGGRVGVRPVRFVLTGGGLEYVAPRVGDGTDARFPSVGELFSPVVAPGLGDKANFLRSTGFVELDYRQPKNARKGGWYRVDFSRYDDRNAGRYTFNRVDADLRQYLGVLAGRRVIALRVFASSAEAEDGSAVPFYLMPTLGGNDSLRGFREYRFRGPHALLLQGEYRWEIWSGLDAALFYDAGKVTLDRSDLNFKDLEDDYGFGFRFNTDNGVVFRVDAAFGSRDGKHLHIVFGGFF